VRFIETGRHGPLRRAVAALAAATCGPVVPAYGRQVDAVIESLPTTLR
jgi:hypothetical protein